MYVNVVYAKKLFSRDYRFAKGATLEREYAGEESNAVIFGSSGGV